MSTAGYVIIVIVLWTLPGVVAAVVLTSRRGRRDLWWYWLGALLGPFFVPVAVERLREKPTRLAVQTSRETRRDLGRGLRVLVGVDGSAEADQALRTVSQALVGSTSELVLVAVVDPDAVDGEGAAGFARARRLVADRSDRIPPELPAPATEVATGPPVAALLEVAAARDVDVIVVGRRGHGMTRRLLGSVAERLVHESPQAVLLAGLRRDED